MGIVCYTGVDHREGTVNVGIVGSRIRDLRLRRGLEPIDLAYHAGISEGYVYRIEGKNPPNVGAEIIAKLAEVLGTSADYLLGRTDDPRASANGDILLSLEDSLSMADLDPQSAAIIQRIIGLLDRYEAAVRAKAEEEGYDPDEAAAEAVASVTNLFAMQLESHLIAVAAGRRYSSEHSHIE